jgi:hypothetical protein
VNMIFQHKWAHARPSCRQRRFLDAGRGRASMIDGASVPAASVPTVGHSRPRTATHA